MRRPLVSLRFSLTLILFATSMVAVGCGDDDAASTSSASSTSSTSSGTGGSGGGEGGAPPTGAISPDVTAYNYRFDLATAHATARVTSKVADPGGDCLSLACRLPGIDTVTWEGAPASSATLADSTLTTCGPGVFGGNTLEIEAQATVPEQTFFGLDVGFSRTTDLAGGTFSYLLSWVSGCDRFGPCDADPSRQVEHHFEVTHGPTDVVLCAGKRAVDGTTTRCDVEGTLAPTYSAFAIAADPLWEASPFVSAAGVDVVFYEVPGGGLADALDPTLFSTFLTWATDLLGPLPYGEELRFAGAPTAWLGFEHPANIILREDMPNIATSYADATMHVAMHEVIHQWAGDHTTLATAQDFVWKEATAEYLAYVFEDEQIDAESAAASLFYWDSIALQANYFPRPKDEPSPAVNKFYGDVYGPGPMVLYVQLEDLIGRPAVLSAIQSFLSSPGARSVDELREALETASSLDLKPYFDAWVEGVGKPEWPTFDVATLEQNGEVVVTLTQQNSSGKIYGCKAEVLLEGATQSAIATLDYGVSPGSVTVSVNVPFSEPLVNVTFDPNHRLVARLKTAALDAAPQTTLPVWIF